MKNQARAKVAKKAPAKKAVTMNKGGMVKKTAKKAVKKDGKMC